MNVLTVPARIILSAMALPVLALGWAAPAAAESVVKFTVTVKSAYLRDAPCMAAPFTYSVFQGQAFLEEPGHDFHLNAEAVGVHVLATLQTLHVIWRL